MLLQEAAMKKNLTVTFWGVRGSYPVPGALTGRFGGNTPCVEILAGDSQLILDAGTGIIALGEEILRRRSRGDVPHQTALFFTHLHHDHTQGFPFFRPAFMPNSRQPHDSEVVVLKWFQR